MEMTPVFAKQAVKENKQAFSLYIVYVDMSGKKMIWKPPRAQRVTLKEN